MGTKKKARDSGDEAGKESCLTLDVFGVAMLLPEDRKVVLVDGRKGRVASDGRTAIPPHVPFIGFQPSAFDRGKMETKPEIAFSYDVDGSGKRMSFECFLLDRHTVTFEGMENNRPIVDDTKIPRMSNVVGKMELCPGVKDGSLERVVATIDLDNAREVAGKDHGHHTHAISFGNKVMNWAEKITAVFEVKNKQPVIRLKPKNGNGKKAAEVVIPLKPNGPWKVMIANVPPEEVMNLNEMDPGQNVPLTHLELLYDLYHIGAGQKLAVPTCASHDMPHANGAGMNGHAAHRVAGSGAHCGPPVSGG